MGSQTLPDCNLDKLLNAYTSCVQIHDSAELEAEAQPSAWRQWWFSTCLKCTDTPVITRYVHTCRNIRANLVANKCAKWQHLSPTALPCPSKICRALNCALRRDKQTLKMGNGCRHILWVLHTSNLSACAILLWANSCSDVVAGFVYFVDQNSNPVACSLYEFEPLRVKFACDSYNGWSRWTWLSCTKQREKKIWGAVVVLRNACRELHTSTQATKALLLVLTVHLCSRPCRANSVSNFES